MTNMLTTNLKPSRYFTYCFEDGEVQICEVSRYQFYSLRGVITTDNHTVAQNGVSQPCYTVAPDDIPDIVDLECV